MNRRASSSFPMAPLGVLCELRSGTVFSPEFQGKSAGEFPFVKVSDMNLAGNEIRIAVANHWVNEEARQALKARPFPPGTTVFAKIGEALKQNRLRYLIRDTIIDNNMMGAIPDPAKVNPRFFYYALSRIDFSSIASGTALPYLTVGDLSRQDLPVPNLGLQAEIASVLQAIDDKFELNQSTSQTLEAIAQAIFKSWFVDSTSDTAEPATLKQLTTKIGSGATPRGGRDVYVDEGIALIRSQNVYDSQFVWDGLARITDEAATQLANVQVQPGDVLLNITGASILRTCVVPPDVLPARVNQHVAIIRAKPGISPHYLHLHLLQPETKAYLLGLNAGGSREAVTKAHIESVPLMDPGAERMSAFHQAVAPLFALAQSLDAENRKLASLRDELLPKLLSGELKPGIHEQADAAMIAEAVGA